jgi:hypothetical protein
MSNKHIWLKEEKGEWSEFARRVEKGYVLLPSVEKHVMNKILRKYDST